MLRPACRRLYSKSAKYGVTHGSNRLPGLEKCSPLVIGSAVVGWLSLCCAVLAPDIVFLVTVAVLQGCTFGTQSLYLLPIQAGTTS